MKERCFLGVLLLSAMTLAGQTQASPAAGNPDVTPAPRVDTVRPHPVQENRGWLQPGEDPENRLLRPFIKHIGHDQKEFWTSPARFRVKDLKWIAPLAGVTAAFIASDSWWAKQVPLSHVQTSLHISDYGLYAMIGLGGTSFIFGHVTHHDRLEEAGLLSAEAAINSTAIAYLLKEGTQRQRPMEGNGHGDFFQGGASFPSEHSAIAWSIASVWAHEYPGWLSQTAAYGLASAITVTRVTAKQHFPSDVIVGAGLGWYFGRQVYRDHHDPEVGGSGWGSLFDEKTGEHTRNPDNMASPYVPIDNWVYPLFDKLAGLGYLGSAHANIRPWTRMECARLLEEVQESIDNDGTGAGEAAAVTAVLVNEFQDEIARFNGAPNVAAVLESLYTRSTEISGSVLHDGFHFGQTLVNDYGRPYGSGFNNVSGVSARAVAGPLAFYIRGEYQHAASVPSEPEGALQAAAFVDRVPALAPNPVPQLDRFRLLDATVAFQVSNLQFSFGQQNLWLGPTAGGPLLYSDNAEPMPMLRIDAVSPYEIPLLSRLLGPVRTQFFLGRFSGQQWSILRGPGLPSQPWLHGTKISFNPTRNFEFGLGFTAQFGGTGNPFTWDSFLRSFYSHKATAATNPAKRLSGFDFSYRIRDWVTFYTDSMVIDEYSPLGSTRPQINPGLYFPRLPKIPKMEVRLEGMTTDLNLPDHFGQGAVYWDERYKSGYTFNGNLIGSWIGRRGRGEEGWVTYSFTPRNTLQFSYRHNNVDPAFLQGGNYQDFSVSSSFQLRSQISLATFVQYETWHFALLSPVGQSNVTGSIELTFWPKWKKEMPAAVQSAQDRQP